MSFEKRLEKNQDSKSCGLLPIEVTIVPMTISSGKRDSLNNIDPTKTSLFKNLTPTP